MTNQSLIALLKAILPPKWGQLRKSHASNFARPRLPDAPGGDKASPDALSSIRTAVEFRFNAALDVSYRIEVSTDLTTWETIETDIIGTGGVITRFYSTESQPMRYFRVRRN